MRVLCVAAARPNFMKIKPVIDGLERVNLETVLLHTGQHYDDAMSSVFFDELGLRPPDVHLGAGTGSHSQQFARVLVAFDAALEKLDPDAVVVVGDVTSTLACAIATAVSGRVLAHIEAGLRSRDWSMPEEVNRVATDRVSDLLFAPSQDAVQNLEAEGYRPDQIHLAGNVMVDTLLSNLDRANERSTPDCDFGFVTLHRPATVDSVETLQPVLDSLGEVSGDIPLVFPVHPRTRATLELCGPLPDSITCLEPMGYLDTIAHLSRAALVLTDSGGIQEETTALGTPCLTLRPNTERPITISEGTNRLVGTDPEAIVRAATEVLREPPAPRCPALWDGKAGNRIAAVIADHLQQPIRKRPTDL